MNSTEIYINGKLCDSPVSVISETKQINNFFELKDRQTSYTNNFELPFTPNNKEIMDFYGVVGNDSKTPYKINNVTIYRNGIPTVENGNALIQMVTFGEVPSYKVNVQSDNISFYDSISNKSLADLDFSSLDHFINDYENNLNLDWQSGYTYPLLDTGYIFENRLINVNYQIPCLFYKWVFNKIFEESGFSYNYVGRRNVFNDVDFEKRVFTVDESLDYDTTKNLSFQKLAEANVNAVNVRIATPLVLNIQNTFEFVDGEDTEDIILFENIRVKGVFRTNIKLKEDGFLSVSFLNTSQSIKLYKNGRFFSDLDVSQFNEIYVRSNDVIHYEVIDNVTNDFNLEFFYRKTSNRVNFKNYFAKIKQKDFVKSVMQDFGLIHRKNRDNVYEFITINDLFFKNTNVVDWSNIFDAKKSLNSKTPTYGQENILSYQYEDDDNFADGSFFIENETLRDEVGVFRSIMRASKITQRFANQSLHGINFWQPETDENGVTTYNANGKKPYSFLVQESGINASYKVGNENSVSISTIPLASFQSISYNNVAPKYYSIYSNVLNRFRLYNVTMRLSAIDVYNLDFFALHYIDILGEYFYINKVKGFKNNKVTEVELISVNTLDVKGEFNNDFNNDFDI